MDSSIEEKGKASKEEQKMAYVSISDLRKRLHQFGGRTRDILDPQDIQRMNELQKHVKNQESDLTPEEWNELMNLKLRAKDKIEKWIEAAKGGDEEEGKLAYVETTPTFKKVKGLDGHVTQICSAEEVATYSKLQPNLDHLTIEEWNELMRTKQAMVEKLEAWVALQNIT